MFKKNKLHTCAMSPTTRQKKNPLPESLVPRRRSKNGRGQRSNRAPSSSGGASLSPSNSIARAPSVIIIQHDASSSADSSARRDSMSQILDTLLTNPRSNSGNNAQMLDSILANDSNPRRRRCVHSMDSDDDRSDIIIQSCDTTDDEDGM